MMSSAPALGIGKTAVAASPAAGEGPQADGDGFLVALTAVAPRPARQAGNAEEPPAHDPAAGDWTQAGLAALLSGLLPAAAPTGRTADAAATSAVDEEVASAASGMASLGKSGRAPGTPLPAPELMEAATELLEGQAATVVDEQVVSPGAARDVLRQLSLALAGTPRESMGEIRPTAMMEPATISPTVHGASQLAPPLAGTGAHAAAEQVLRAPVGSPRWAEELGSRLVMLSARGQHDGSLTLTPEHLGPLEVRITVNQNTANVWFGAQQADTRAALTEALPRLRELFAEAGLALGESGVSQEAPRQGNAERVSWGDSSGAVAEDVPAPVERRQIASALLDLYA
jgi:flagellar hook-length control protein FliK